MLRHSYLLVAFGVALAAQPSSARAHSAASHHTAYRHYRHHRLAWRDGEAARERYAFADANDGAWRPREAWSQENSWSRESSWQQQNFAGQNFTGNGFRSDDEMPYSERSRRYAQGWNSQPAERSFGDRSQVQGLAEQQASANGIPVSLVDRVIRRESGGNPRVVSRGNYGLMQIRLGTARAMGYRGSAAGLLDASTNMTYAVRYLAGAYRAAGGNESRAVALYARGYRTARVQDASYYGEGPQDAAFAGGAYEDSFAPRMVRRLRHDRHRML